MKLRDWRHSRNLSLAELGRMLGLGGVNPARAVQRIETGEQGFDADLAERIAIASQYAVRPQDLHETRLEWLRANKPQRLAEPFS